MACNRTKTLTILLLAAPFSSQYVNLALKVIQKALDKGYNVNLFLYSEGVHLPKKGQKTIEEQLRKLITKGLRVKACASCALIRGYVDGEIDNKTGSFPTKQYVDGVIITSLFDFSDWIRKSDKVINFGG